jgi:diguanylate cyclase (GGDEF)-like protein
MTMRTKTPSALIADDDEISRLFLIETLEQAGFRTVAVADGGAALAAADAEQFSLALLDVNMPQLDGYEVCRAMRATPDLKHLPIVMITGCDDPASIARAFDAGATDFISKPVNWTLLPHRMRYILRNADNDRRLRHLAYHDALTGLPNSQALLDLAADAIVRAETAGAKESVALLEVSVEACTRIRAMFGSDAGDEALRAFARTLEECVAAADSDGDRIIVARADGDRFVVCLRDGSAHKQAMALSMQLMGALDEPVLCAEHHFFLPPTVGIALFPEHGRDVKTLLTHAATAKHHATTTESTAAVTYTDSIGARARESLELGAALREAVRAEQLTLYFQPKIRIADGSLAGVEALLRWFDQQLGEVSPARFVPLAEESGLILDIGRWVVRAACRQLMNWQQERFETTIAVNVSGKQFLHDDPAELITCATAAAGLKPASVVVEITESSLIGDLASARVQSGLRALRALGCRIAIDDFGTGYSSLAYLRGLPIDELKLDRSFIRNVDSDHVDAAICVAVLSLARELGLSVTAEGIESASQLQWFHDHGCNEAQGFFLARPMPAHEILRRYAVAPRIRGRGSSAI